MLWYQVHRNTVSHVNQVVDFIHQLGLNRVFRARRAQPHLQTELSQRRRARRRQTQCVHTGASLDSLFQVQGRVRRVLVLLALTSRRTEHVGRARRAQRTQQAPNTLQQDVIPSIQQTNERVPERVKQDTMTTTVHVKCARRAQRLQTELSHRRRARRRHPQRVHTLVISVIMVPRVVLHVVTVILL